MTINGIRTRIADSEEIAICNTTEPNVFDASIVSISWWKGLLILASDLMTVPRLYHAWKQLRAIRPLGLSIIANSGYFLGLYNSFFARRDLQHLLHYVGEHVTPTGHRGFHFAYVNVRDSRSNFEDAEMASHGTSFGFLRAILLHGGLVASRPRVGAMRAANYGEGVYCSPSQTLALTRYAVPQVVFGDGIYHKVVVSLLVDRSHPTFKVAVPNKEWIGSEGILKVAGVYLFPNVGVGATEPRLDTWYSCCEPNVQSGAVYV